MSYEKIARALEAAADDAYKQGELKFLAAEAISELLCTKTGLQTEIRELEKQLQSERKRREELAWWLQDKAPKAEQQAIFRLGQKDMQASAVDLLRDAAVKLASDGAVRATLLIAADMIQVMEVP